MKLAGALRGLLGESRMDDDGLVGCKGGTASLGDWFVLKLGPSPSCATASP